MTIMMQCAVTAKNFVQQKNFVQMVLHTYLSLPPEYWWWK